MVQISSLDTKQNSKNKFKDSKNILDFFFKSKCKWFGISNLILYRNAFIIQVKKKQAAKEYIPLSTKFNTIQLNKYN